jgi:hypothetical protein
MALRTVEFTNILPIIISEYIIKNTKLFREIKINVYAKNMPLWHDKKTKNLLQSWWLTAVVIINKVAKKHDNKHY